MKRNSRYACIVSYQLNEMNEFQRRKRFHNGSGGSLQSGWLPVSTLAAAKVKQATSLRLSHLQVKVWTRMGKSQSKDEVKEAGAKERKEERFVSTYCKAMRSLFLLSAKATT